jgi:hypothetical protein
VVCSTINRRTVTHQCKLYNGKRTLPRSKVAAFIEKYGTSEWITSTGTLNCCNVSYIKHVAPLQSKDKQLVPESKSNINAATTTEKDTGESIE